MKPEIEISQVEENDEVVTGDVIGETAYSERFVLKLLLKFANLDTLKDELSEKSFEEDLCTLWDMTAERDVVIFLQKYDVLNLFQFALPVISSQRIVEIIIGIIGNMCCVKELVGEIFKMDSLLPILVTYITSDDSSILIQVLRIVNYCLLLCTEDQIPFLMNLFERNDYSKALYFILKNSLNKELLTNSLENLNTICTQCNIDKTRSEFFQQFVSKDAIESLWSGFKELLINQKDSCERDEFERMLIISLQIILNLVGFDKSPEIYKDNKKDVAQMIQYILSYNESVLIDKNVLDPDLVEIIDSINTIKCTFQWSETCDEDLFESVFKMWKTVKSYNKNSTSDQKDAKSDECIKQLTKTLSTFICKYIETCNERHLLKVLDKICNQYEDIVHDCNEEVLQTAVTRRTSSYRSRINENVDS